MAPIPGRPFVGIGAAEHAFRHLQKYHGIEPHIASHRLHRLKAIAELGPADEVEIGRTGDVYDGVTGERLGTLTDKTLGHTA